MSSFSQQLTVFLKGTCVCVCVCVFYCVSTFDLSLTELEGLRLSWDRLSGGNWKSAGRVVFLLLTLRADLLMVVAA